MTQAETYRTRYECWNCYAKGELAIPKGTLVRDALAKGVCHHCGCKTLRAPTDWRGDPIRPILPFSSPISSPPGLGQTRIWHSSGSHDAY